MNRISLLILIILLNLTLSPAEVLAGRDKKVATTASPFLKIGVGARVCGMGEAFVGLSDDTSAIYWNPAGLAQLAQPELIAVHNHWFSDINHEFIAYAHPVDEKTTLGIGSTLVYIDDIERRDAPTVEPTGKFTASDTLFILSCASKLTNKRIMLGGNMKIILQKIESKKAGNIAFDLGTLYAINDKTKLGIVIQNIGYKLNIYKEDFSLPICFKIGIGYNLIPNHLKAATDLTLYKDNNPTYAVGIEYSVGKVAFLRLGYRKKSAELPDGILSGITLGAGFKILNSQIDYGYVPYDNVGDSHRISLIFRF